MVYSKRFDGRKFDELREVEAKVGVIKSADGSAMFRMGKTIAIAAVRGPRNLHPRFMQNPEKGILSNRKKKAWSIKKIPGSFFSYRKGFASSIKPG